VTFTATPPEGPGPAPRPAAANLDEEAADGQSQPAWRRFRSLRTYLIGLVLLALVAAAANFFYLRGATLNDARHSAESQASFEAAQAADSIATAIQRTQAGLVTSASVPAVATLLGEPKPACSLASFMPPPFLTGHLDFIRPSGSVACSSSSSAQSSRYQGASWLAAAMKSPLVVPLVRDGQGHAAVLVAAPVHGKGAVVTFIDLGNLGQGLAKILSGPLRMSYVVTTSNGSRSITSSADPGRWVDAPLAGTAFSRAAGTSEHADLQGVSRIYGEAAVHGLPWKVFAGASTATALAAANRTSERDLLLSLASLLVFLAALWIIYLRITHPISKLSTAVRAAAAHHSRGPVNVRGPVEVEALAGDFAELISASEREVEALSRLSAIVESSADAIVGMTVDGTVTSWNAGAEAIYGYRADEMIGQNVAVLWPPASADEARASLDRVRAGEQAEILEAKRVRRDGSQVEVSVAYSPIFAGRGSLAGISSVARDVSERKRAEAARRELEKRVSDFEQQEEQNRELRLLADRERIGRDLHEHVVQQLFATGLSLQSAAARSAETAVRERIAKAVDDIDEAIRRVRTVVFAESGRAGGRLRDSALELIHDSRPILGFAAAISFSGPVDTRVPGYVADQLLATLREAISNISRHAQANQVDVTVIAGTDIVLTVSDDGGGFGPGIPPDGKEFGNMQARAEQLGGTCTPRVGKGGGTVIEWRVPAPEAVAQP
jgi:two-component system, NarL family, sensor histidine kinase DevS